MKNLYMDFVSKVRKRETPFYRWLYYTYKRLLLVSMPGVPIIYDFFWHERKIRLSIWNRFLRSFYYEPMFKRRYKHKASGLMLIGGMPFIAENLELNFGKNLTLHGRSVFYGGHTDIKPTITIGDHTYLGYGLELISGSNIKIGSHVLISNQVTLMGYDSHPLNAKERADNKPAGKDGCGDIIVGDYVWIGTDVFILKGVTIGEGAVIGAASVVTKDIPPYTIAVGQPAKVIKEIPKN